MSAARMEVGSWEERTVVASGVPDVLPDVLSARTIRDKLTVHFQTRRRSHGGDVQAVRYPTDMDGVAFVTFDDAADAEKVVLKEEQIMTDDKFPQDYPLTVFPYTKEVSLYVSSATVDLWVFGSGQAALIQSLRSAHRSVRFQPLLEQRKAVIEGPLSAVRALREDLIRRAHQLPVTAVRPKLNQAVHSMAFGSGDQESSAPQQTTGQTLENYEVPHPLSTMKETIRASEERFKQETEIPPLSSGLNRLPAEGTSKQHWVSHTGPDRDRDNHLWSDDCSDPSRFQVSEDPGQESELKAIWVDSDVFMYMVKFSRKELDTCLRGLASSIKCDDGTGLTLVLLSAERNSKMSSMLQDSSELLECLVRNWQSNLRVHVIRLDKDEPPDKQQVIQICDDVSRIYNNVLYVLGNCCIKVIGPSLTSHLFCSSVKERIDDHRSISH